MSDWLKALKKFWNFVWSDDSLLSWIVSIVLAFLLIKFIIYPGIGLILGTNLPVVAVISPSMEHHEPFDKWWASDALCGDSYSIFANYSKCSQADWYGQMGITYDQFKKFPMHEGFNMGDIIILKGSSYDNLKVGDIIVYQAGVAYPIIHRVVAKDDMIQTKGDNNPRQILTSQINEKAVTKSQILGNAWLRIPYLGYVKIWAVDGLKCVTFQGCSFN